MGTEVLLADEAWLKIISLSNITYRFKGHKNSIGVNKLVLSNSKKVLTFLLVLANPSSTIVAK